MLKSESLQEYERQLDNIFKDEMLLDCMEERCPNTGSETSHESKNARWDAAVAAFSMNPPCWWDGHD